MPVSRHSRALSPSSSANMTPARTNARTLSSYSNYTPTLTPGSNSGRMNVVTRVALEGRAKHGDDGAAIKMYLKIAVPLDSIIPGTTIPLFPEESIKILSSQVHPLDTNSVPYNFSSTVSPLLHRAASALNLPARSQETFNSVFDTSSNVSTPTAPRASKLDNSENIPPVDPQYTGHILVSGYNISYVLPKSFPSQLLDQEEPYSRSSSRSRRPSISERNTVQFMAAIDMWVPYVSKPARYPYLLSIPTPRCLHNHIKLRIFPPNNTYNSYASLSSVEDEGTTWDLTSDPHVTRATSARLARSSSYNNFADDESSDSSTAGFSEGCGIQGTFPSAERIRIRWARPSKAVNVPGGGRDGRRRVGVKHVKGEMTCVVRGKHTGSHSGTTKGVFMEVSYTGSCSGVWFPGVATLLGMDVGLEAKGCDVGWAEGYPSQWTVSGGTGFTGFDVGPSTNVPAQPNSRGSSFEFNSTQDGDLAAPNGAANGFLSSNQQGSRSSSTSSTSSLLRAPLPTGGAGEYSFDGSTLSLPSNGFNSSPLGTISSIASISLSVPSLGPPNPKPPGLPITLHLNMNELLPPAKNVFTFTISGTVHLIPRNPLSRLNGSQSRSSSPLEGSTAAMDPGLIMLPKFTVLAADSESTSTIVRNEAHGAVEVYHATGDIHRDAQAKKTVLQKTGFTKCGNDGARIVVKDHDPFKRDDMPPHQPSTPASSRAQRSLARSAIPDFSTTTPPTISVVTAIVVPFPTESSATATVYSVSLRLHVPVVEDSGWLEFGFAHGAGAGKSVKGDPKLPKLQLVSATADGIPVEVETSVSTEVELSNYGVGIERLGGKEWASWIKLKVGAMRGSEVVVDYLVKEDLEKKSEKGKAREKCAYLPLLLPTFSLPIGKFDVNVCSVRDFDVVAASNFTYQQAAPDGYRLMQFPVEEFFYPQLSLTFTKKKPSAGNKFTPYFIVTWILFALAAFTTLRVTSRYQGINQECQRVLQPEVEHVVPTVTVVSTAYETTTMLPTSIQDHRSSNPPATSTTTPSVPTYTSSSSTTKPAPSFIPPSLPNIGLQPIRDAFPFSWPDDLSAAREVYGKVVQAVGILWKYLRKAYHYPLEAP